MDVKDISLEGKKKFTEWLSIYREISIAKLVKDAEDEEDLFVLCSMIDDCQETKRKLVFPPPQERSGPSKTIVQVPTKYIPIKQYDFSRGTMNRLNEFIANHPDAYVTKMISESTNEAELLKKIEEIESREAVIDCKVKLWCVRHSQSL